MICRLLQPLAPVARPNPAREIATHLRRLADQIERGEVDRVRVTVIRPGGDIERLGEIPDVVALIQERP